MEVCAARLVKRMKRALLARTAELFLSLQSLFVLCGDTSRLVYGLVDKALGIVDGCITLFCPRQSFFSRGWLGERLVVASSES